MGCHTIIVASPVIAREPLDASNVQRTMTGVYELFVVAYRNGLAVEMKFHTPTK